MNSFIILYDDILLRNQKIEEIKKQYDIDFEDEKYDLEDDSLYSINDEATTISLFDNPKCIIVNSVNEIKSAKQNAFDELIDAIADQNNSNLIIFTSKVIDLNDKYIETIKKYSTYIDSRIKNISLKDYAKTTLDNDGYKIDIDALELLTLYSEDLMTLRNSIEKLELYKLDDKKISDIDVKLLVSKPLDNNVYDLVEAVLSHDRRKVFNLYNDMKVENISNSYLLSLIITKFQEMYNVYILAKNGATQEDIANIFKVKSGKAYYMMKNSKKSSLNEIKDNLKYLNNLEYDIKSGRITDDRGLELYFLK